jgi:hypothetical protein
LVQFSQPNKVHTRQAATNDLIGCKDRIEQLITWEASDELQWTVVQETPIDSYFNRVALMSDAYARILAGKQSYQIPPGDYLNIVHDPVLRETIEARFAQFGRNLNYLVNKYQTTCPAPTLFADPLLAISARATSSRIIISRGLVDHLDLLASYPTIPMPEFSYEMPAPFLSDLAGFWILAHEYFHIARGHLGLDAALYKNHPWGFEYDADCLATAALYRYIVLNTGPGTSRRFAKAICLVPIYWCVRTLICYGSVSAPRTAHPQWEERLFYCILKISTFDLAQPNGVTDEHYEEVEFLGSLSGKFEKIFFSQNSSMRNDYDRWVLDYVVNRIDHDTAAHQWEPLVDIVEKNSRLLSDRGIQHNGLKSVLANFIWLEPDG